MNTVINDQLSTADMVNLARYPITSLGSVAGSTFALQCRSQVVEWPFSASTLLIFGGQQTLHRVTRVSGNHLRLAPVLH